MFVLGRLQLQAASAFNLIVKLPNHLCDVLRVRPLALPDLHGTRSARKSTVLGRFDAFSDERSALADVLLSCVVDSADDCGSFFLQLAVEAVRAGDGTEVGHRG